MNNPRRRFWPRLVRFVLTTAFCAGILAAAGAAIVVINRTEPTAKQVKATRKSAALVETQVVRRNNYAPRLSVLGTVRPARDITLSPRVSGQILEVAESFVPGGIVREGSWLVKIDKADFENQYSIRVSELEQRLASLKIEEGRQSLAKKELKLLESTIDETNRELVLRGPQIASIRAEVSAAKAAVQRAKLDLDRTTIVAPFDAQILSQSCNVGSQVSPGNELARLVGVEEYWITAAVPVRSLQWIRFPMDDAEGSDVELRNADAWPAGATRKGRVTRMIGTVDERTRLAQVLITVNDPLGRESEAPPLILQSLLQLEIEGRTIERVFRLRREHVRDEDTVWVMKEGKLAIRDCRVVFRDETYAYIESGLADGEHVVISTLATVADGIDLRRIEESGDVESDDVDPGGEET